MCAWCIDSCVGSVPPFVTSAVSLSKLLAGVPRLSKEDVGPNATADELDLVRNITIKGRIQYLAANYGAVDTVKAILYDVGGESAQQAANQLVNQPEWDSDVAASCASRKLWVLFE